MQWLKVLAYDRPMQLFSDEAEVDQFDKRLLQHEHDLFADLAAQGWQMRIGSGCWH